MDLPTEAQWEYAARSRGQYLPFSTNNGMSLVLRSTLNKRNDNTQMARFPIYPIGKYPPNPLGLYDMGLSGAEWSNDWYSTDYYSHSPVGASPRSS
ncbi:formylglycine-generating enzyme family protein [Klebsiella pneumoniae]|uniref:formylglycine-generating enzyme family protein n=1 Tax=Klebsiella pneumoniae TaxID=573 RepID=UPI001E4913F1|nr:SUMF1/EgtB/PvdO family nonheme iron enzyme [Klebsiella pneumoniae]